MVMASILISSRLLGYSVPHLTFCGVCPATVKAACHLHGLESNITKVGSVLFKGRVGK